MPEPDGITFIVCPVCVKNFWDTPVSELEKVQLIEVPISNQVTVCICPKCEQEVMHIYAIDVTPSTLTE